MNVKIREAVPGDVEAIISVGRHTWPVTYAFAGPEYIEHGMREWWSAGAIERSLKNTKVLVAEEEDTIVATGNIDLRHDVPIIWKLYVVPLAQGTGVGSALIQELLAAADGRPVQLEYIDGNDKAAAFYARHGFVEVWREPNGEPGWPAQVWVERKRQENREASDSRSCEL